MPESAEPWVTALLWLDADGNGELYGSMDSPNVIFNAALVANRQNRHRLGGIV